MAVSRIGRRRRTGPVCDYTYEGVTCGLKGDHYCDGRRRHFSDFCKVLLVHTKGDFARQPFVLSDWQETEIARPLFGEVVYSTERRRYVRRYRTLYLNVARKNGKSFLAAAIILFLLVADFEEEAELYGLALDKDQAGHVKRTAERMVELNPILRRRLDVIKSAGRIVDPRSGSFFAVIAGDAAGALGANPHGAYIDELLTQPDRELYDSIRTGMGTRAQPLLLLVTTAENDPAGFAADERQFSERVLEDPSLDPTRLVVIHTCPVDADWSDEANWHEANPGLGEYLSLQTLRDEFRQALNNPTAERSFRQYRLNQPTSAVGRAIDLTTWDQSAGLIDETELVGRDCYGGLDLASTSDLAAYALTFVDDDGYTTVVRHFTPEANVSKIDRRTGGKASVWAKEGWLTVTEGDVIDYDAIKLSLARDAEKFRIVEVGFDRWNAGELVQDMMKDGLTMVPLGQGYATASGPTVELLRQVQLGGWRHGGNPVLRWEAGNLVTHTDPAGNIKPAKDKSPDKIDGIVASIMALNRAILRPPPKKRRTVASF